MSVQRRRWAQYARYSAGVIVTPSKSSDSKMAAYSSALARISSVVRSGGGSWTSNISVRVRDCSGHAADTS